MNKIFEKLTPQNIILVSLFALVLVVAAMTLWPLVTTILTAFIIGYVFYPVYCFINKKLKKSNLSAVIVIIIIVLLLIVPSFFMVNTLAKEVYTVYTKTKQFVVAGSLGSEYCEQSSNMLCGAISKFNEIFGDTSVRFYIQDGIERLTANMINWATDFAFSLPMKIAQGIIMLFMVFYFLKEHDKITDKIKLILPMKMKHRQDIMKKVDDVIYAVVFGSILVALIEGVIGVIGFWLFMPNSTFLFWGVIIAFTALIPMVGSWIVWLPAIIIQFANHNYFSLIGLALCWIIVAYVDTFTRAKIIGNRAKIHPAYIVIGVIGGIALFGIIGVVIGPMVLALVDTFLKIFTTKEAAAE
jgi:predicted PurR-regulated permease PerM